MEYFIIICLFLFGSVMGSFYTVVASRLPQNKSIIKPGSHCEFCNHFLKWYELIPIISFLIQKGKCHKCRKKLSLLYPASELATGILFVISYLKFGIGPSFLISLILSSIVVLIFVSDIKYMIILDSPLIISAILIFGIKWYESGIFHAFSSCFSGLLTFLTMFAIGRLGDIVFKRESLGGGDIKLSFLFGMVLGYQMSIAAIVLSTFLALPYAFACLFLNKNHEVPFGPFLVSALWIVFFFFEKFERIVPFLLQI